MREATSASVMVEKALAPRRSFSVEDRKSDIRKKRMAGK